ITKQVKVFVPPAINLTGSDNITTCEPEAEICATVDVPASLNWFDEQGAFLSSLSCITVDVSGASNYMVTARDQYNCQEQDVVAVIGGPVESSLTDDQVLCSDDPLNVTLTNLDPNDVLSLQWSPSNLFIGDPTNDPTPVINKIPGEHDIYVEATNQFGCSKTDSLHLAIVDSDIHLDFDFEVQCNGFTVEFTNLSTNAYNFVWDFGDPNNPGATSTDVNPTYTYTELGTYFVTLNIGFDVDCVIPITKQIEIVTPDFIPDFDFEFNADCSTEGVTISLFDESLNFLNNTFNWEWVFSTGEHFIGGIDFKNVEISVTGNQTVVATMIITTANGCSGSVTKEIEVVLPELPAPIGGEVILCYGDTAQLNPNGNDAFLYNWSPPNGTLSGTDVPNPSAFPLETTQYSVTVTSISADTCSVAGDVLVTVPERLFVEASDEVKTTCGTPVQIEASANVQPVNFSWATLDGVGLGVGPMLSVNPATEMTVEVTGTDAFGCFDKDTVLVTNEKIDFELNAPATACPADTIQISANNTIADHVLEYTWTASNGEVLGNPNAPDVVIVTSPAGQVATFTVMVENQYGCQDEKTTQITSYDFVPTVVPDILVCPDVPSEINPGANPALTYSWSPANMVMPPDAANPMVQILSDQTFQVTVTQSFGADVCEAVRSTFVEVPEIIEIEETVDTLTCGEPITICATGNVPNLTFEWFEEGGNALASGNCFDNANPVTEAIYIVQATDEFECTALDTVLVSNRETDVQIDGNGFISTCPRDSFQICIANLDAEDQLTYDWSVGNNGQILSGQNEACPWVTTTPNETAFFTVTATNQFGCSETQTLEVLTYEFNATVDTIVRVCSDVPTEINPNFTPGLTYSWSPADKLDNPNSPNPVITTTENTTLMATILGFNGADTCTATLTVNVLVNPLINLDATPEAPILCSDTTITFLAKSDTVVDMVWSANPDFSNPVLVAPQVTISELEVNPVHTETYYVEATDDLGCVDVDTVVVHSYPIDASLEDYYVFCKENETIELLVTNNDPAQDLSYKWSPEELVLGDPTTNPVEMIFKEDTGVFVEVQNQFGCTDTISTNIRFFDLSFGLTATADPDTLIFGAGEFAQLNTTDNADWYYEWTPCESLSDCNVPNPEARPEETTTYFVTVSNIFGCLAEQSVEVTVINPECGEPFVFIPTAFSPNGDGENDVLYVRGNNLESLTFAVYNRWGQQVFETTDKNFGWNGTFKNDPLPPGVYGYYLKAKCFNGQEYFKKGNITLVR
ncbi:MAG: PKD domain-containing protein, partial [Bacteroidetes bacterium]